VAVKRSQSASRVLGILEGIATYQPVGVSELARQFGTDKSGVQRAIMTLADGGWIRAAPGTPTRWELTPHILTVAHRARSSSNLLLHARAILEALLKECSESVLLAVPATGHFVVVDVLESPQLLRTMPHVGMVVPARDSATSGAILPYMSEAEQMAILGEVPDAVLRKEMAKTIERGYSLSGKGEFFAGSVNIGAAVMEKNDHAIAAIVVSAPANRIGTRDEARLGAMVAAAAGRLSREMCHTAS
jgi:IclR family acetate operon transcriptional repressor